MLITMKEGDEEYAKLFDVPVKFSKDIEYEDFILTIQYLEPVRKNCWTYTKGIVKNKNTGEQICEIRRNYSSFPYAFVKGENGHTYFITGHHYQYFVIVDLDNGTYTKYEKDFDCFCFSEICPGEDGHFLVFGCYWAGPYEYKLYKINSCDDVKIMDNIDRLGGGESPDETMHWDNDGYFRIPFFSYYGRDGSAESDDYWGDFYDDENLTDKPPEECHMFMPNGNDYTPEFINNFLFHLTISPDEIYTLEDRDKKTLFVLNDKKELHRRMNEKSTFQST